MAEESAPADVDEQEASAGEAESAGEGRWDLRDSARLGRVANVVGILVLVAVVLPFVLFLVPQLIGAEASYVVTSGSMEPAIPAGSILFVENVEPGAVSEGDIVNFRRGTEDITTTHRVVEVLEEDGERRFRTAGDNNPGEDPGVVTPAELQGRVIEVAGAPAAIPYVGYVIDFAGTDLGFSLLFVVPVTLLVINEVWKVITSARPDAEASVSTDGGDTAAADSADQGDGENPSTIGLRPRELRLAIFVLVAFVAYSGLMVFDQVDPLRVGVLGSAIVATMLFTGVYVVGRPPDEANRPDGLVIRTEPAPAEDTEAPVETVSRLEALIGIAAQGEGGLARDPDTGTYHLETGGTVYLYRAGEQTGDTDAPVEPATDQATERAPESAAQPEGATHPGDTTAEGDDD